MAWTHYTSYFKDGILPPILTNGMRSEIYAALKERTEGTIRFYSDTSSADEWQVDWDYVDELLASGIQVSHDKEIKSSNVRSSLASSVNPVETLFQFIRRLSFEYQVDDIKNERWGITGGKDIIEQAATDLGVTLLSGVDSSQIDALVYWDVVRRSIMLLRYGHALFIDGSNPRSIPRKRKVNDPRRETWAEALDDYYAEIEVDTTATASLFTQLSGNKSSGGYFFLSDRKEPLVKFPNSSVFSGGYDAWTFAEVDLDEDATIVMSVGNASSETLVTAYELSKKIKVTGATEMAASISSEIRLKGTNISEIAFTDAFEPATNGQITATVAQRLIDSTHSIHFLGAGFRYFGFVIQGTFTHPFEAIV